MISTLLAIQEFAGTEKILAVHGNWATVCHAAHLEGDHSVLVANMPHAITHLLKRYSRMRTRLHIADSRPLLETFDYDEQYLNADMFYSIVDNNDQSWQKIAEDRCNQNPYTENETIIFPLFHFMLLTDPKSPVFHLLIFSNHCVSDGRSGYILINDLLTLATSPDLLNKIEPVNIEILPSIVQLMPRPYGLCYPMLVFFTKLFFKRELRRLQYPQIPVKITFLEGEKTRFRHQRVKNKFLFASSSLVLYPRLYEKCHSQQITLQGPLLGCLFLAIHHCFLNDKDNLHPFLLDLDFDMRSRLPKSPLTHKTVGYCICSATVKLRRQLPIFSTPFWSLANECMTITHQALTSTKPPLFAHLFWDISKDERTLNQVSEVLPDGRAAEMNFSNIGRYPYSCEYNNGQVQLRGLHVVNNCAVYRPSNIVFVTCAGDRQLDFSLTHEMESDEKAQEFLDYYVRLIEACADAETDINLHQLLSSVEFP